MTDRPDPAVTRRRFFQTGAFAAAAMPSSPCRTHRAATKVLDFTTTPTCQGRQEGEVVYYGHDGEAGSPSCSTRSRRTSPRSDQLRPPADGRALRQGHRRALGGTLRRRRAPALRHLPGHRLPEEGRLGAVPVAGVRRLQARVPVDAGRLLRRAGCWLRGHRVQPIKVKPEQAPKTWKDINNPACKDGVSVKLATSGMQHSQWYILRKMYGNDFWQEFAKQRPKGFDARASSSTGWRRAMTACARWPSTRATRCSRRRAPRSTSWRRPRGCPPSHLHRRRQQGAASGGGEALRRLGDVQARPGRLPEPEDPAVRLGAQRHGPDADRQAAVGLQAALPDRLERLRREPSRLREGMERDHGVSEHPLGATARAGPVVEAGPAACQPPGRRRRCDPRPLPDRVPDPGLAQRRRSAGAATGGVRLDNFTGLGRYAHIFGNTLPVAAVATVSPWSWASSWVDPLAHERPGRAAFEQLMALPYYVTRSWAPCPGRSSPRRAAARQPGLACARRRGTPDRHQHAGGIAWVMALFEGRWPSS